MKIYISVDMEGITGVCHTSQIIEGQSEYEDSRMMMTQDVNAAIEGAIEAGASEILVNDAHNTMRNILLEPLNPAARLLSGSSKKYMMMEGLDDSFDAAMFIGYHVRANSKGILGHTTIISAFYSVKINGTEVGETELNAAVAGHFGVPVIMVSGDDCLCEQVNKFNPDIEFAVTKKSYAKQAARLMPPAKTYPLIKQKAKDSVSKIDKFKPYVISGPIEVELKFNNSVVSFYDAAQLMPKIKAIPPDTVIYTAGDILEAYNAIDALAFIGIGTKE